ncbi:MAG: hypothetical protein M0Q51_15205 [Bacteroidales bacterium]|nr:hypothetical protein [Bacteroidales bacterium]
MDRLKLKQKILDACFEQQTKVTQNLKVVMEEVADSAEEYGLPKDLYDSYRNQMMSKRDMFAQQVLKINEQIDILRRVDMKRTYNQIRFGAVVITESQHLFIATGIGKVNVEGEEYFVISAMVPFYTAIDGKRAGDTYEFRGKKEKILEVF